VTHWNILKESVEFLCFLFVKSLFSSIYESCEDFILYQTWEDESCHSIIHNLIFWVFIIDILSIHHWYSEYSSLIFWVFNHWYSEYSIIDIPSIHHWYSEYSIIIILSIHHWYSEYSIIDIPSIHHSKWVLHNFFRVLLCNFLF
jgi:hypothetical protein